MNSTLKINSLSNIIYIGRKEDKFMVVKVRKLVMLTDKQKAETHTNEQTE